MNTRRTWTGWGNWWFYNKGYAITAILVLIALISFIYGKVTEVKPDLSVAIVTNNVIPEEAAAQLEAALESVCEDYNHDGKVYVKIAGYGDPDADALGAESAAYKQASETELIADISSCDSYLFVTDDPVYLQREYQILANPDGSCPEDTDYSASGKTIPLTSLFSERDGITNEFLKTCSIGRRCFYDEKTCKYIDDLQALWNSLAAR